MGPDCCPVMLFHIEGDGLLNNLDQSKCLGGLDIPGVPFENNSNCSLFYIEDHPATDNRFRSSSYYHASNLLLTTFQHCLK